MRRCLHAFLIAVLTLAPSMDAARACWHVRARRQGRPAHVVSHCPPPAWSECGELVVVREWIVAVGCCPPQAACCDGMLVEAVVVSDAAAPAGQSRPVVVEAPPPAAGGDAVGGVQLEPVPAGEPQPRLGGADVLPASNDLPVAEAEPADTDAFPPVAAEREMPEAEPTAPLPPTDEEAPLPGEPVAPEMPEEEAMEPPPADGLDAEPPLEAEPEPAPVADEPVAEPEPPAPEPAPAEPNLFEEEEAAAPAADEEMPEDAASPFAADDPAAGADGEASADDGGPLDGVVAGDTEEMVEDAGDVPAADAVTDEPAPADPFADDSGVPAAEDDLPMEEEPLPAATEDEGPAPFPADDEPEPAPLEDAAGTEPSRRWIHATGAHSLVATLVDVVDDGTCVLETEGRRIRVPLENLSDHDREYVRDAGVRLAALRDQRERAARAAATRAPQATDTAGL